MDRLSGPLSALVLAAGCTVNPFYTPPETSAGSTTTGAGGSSTSAATTMDASTTSSTSGVSSEPATSTTGLPPDMGVIETGGSSSGGECAAEQVLVIQGFGQIDDAYFTINPMGTGCDLFEVSDALEDCGALNLGQLEGMKMVRKAEGPEVMFALQPTGALDELIESLELQGNQILGAQINVTLYDLSEDVTFNVGLIAGTDMWLAGGGYGTLPADGEATFDLRVAGDAPEYWTNKDGPRGASNQLCDMKVPAGDYGNHPRWVVCDLDPMQLNELALSHGVVIYYPKGPEAYAGPGIKSTEASQEFAPSIEVRYCPP